MPWCCLGQPVLDRENQVLRLTNIELDVNSEAAFGCSARRRARRCRI